MRRSGPIGRSCLTCRNRRKKCDQTRPICERCRKGNFECLGYDCDALLGGMSPDSSHEQASIWWGDVSQGFDTRKASSTTPGTSCFFNIDSPGDSDSTVLPLPSATSEALACPSSDGSVGRYHTNSALRPSGSNSLRGLGSQAANQFVSLPSNMSWVPPDIANMIGTFMSRFGQLAGLSLFRLTHQQIMTFRDMLTWRLCNFPSTRWAMLAADRLFDCLITGTPLTTRDVAIMMGSINRIEQLVLSTPSEALTTTETRTQATGSLELALLRLRMSDLDSYTVLRTYAPTFVQVVFSDPSIWSSSSADSTAVPLAHVLTSAQHETANFVMLDMMCALAYGLPELIEYDTSIPPLDDEVHLSEFVHGCPPRLRLIFSDINVLASWNRMGPRPDWHTLEQRLKEWQPTIRSAPGYESWKMVAGLAIQESWRHTLLIYLYMAACGASSDEPQVAKSVRQVFKTVSAVQSQLPRLIHFQLFIPLLIAGAFSPTERHRALARTQLIGRAAPRVWLLDMSRFVPVLDDLWHGAAVNGNAIRWSDYVHSRQAVIPV